MENSYLSEVVADEDPMQALFGHSITYRIATAHTPGSRPKRKSSVWLSMSVGRSY
jgi:hypothetical protein